MSTRHAPSIVLNLLIFAAAVSTLVLHGCGVSTYKDPTSLLLTEEQLYSPAELRVGDAAPLLVIGEWLNGDPIGDFQPGKVYLVDFWARWCTPCLLMMERLSLIQERFADRNVTAVAITSLDQSNTYRDVTSTYRKLRDKMRFRVAIDGGPNGNSTVSSYLKAARMNGLPTTFVVDQNGRLAWYGHPQDLEPILDSVLAGTWDLSAAAALSHRRAAERPRARVLIDEYDAARSQRDTAREMIVLEELTAMDPESLPVAATFLQHARYITLLIAGGQRDAAQRAYARAMTYPEYTNDPRGLAELATAILPIDPSSAESAATQAETITLLHEKQFRKPTDEWEAFMRKAYREWEAQAMALVAEIWYRQGDTDRAIRLITLSIDMSDRRSPENVARREAALKRYQDAPHIYK